MPGLTQEQARKIAALQAKYQANTVGIRPREYLPEMLKIIYGEDNVQYRINTTTNQVEFTKFPADAPFTAFRDPHQHRPDQGARSQNVGIYPEQYDRLSHPTTATMSPGFDIDDANFLYDKLFGPYYIDPLKQDPETPYPDAFITPVIEFQGMIFDVNPHTPNWSVTTNANIEQYFKIYLDKIIADRDGIDNMPPPYKVVMPFSGLMHAMSMVVEFHPDKTFTVTATNPDVAAYGNRYKSFAQLNYKVIKKTLEDHGLRASGDGKLKIGPDIQIIDGPCELVNIRVAEDVLRQANTNPSAKFDDKAVANSVSQSKKPPGTSGAAVSRDQEKDYWKNQRNALTNAAAANQQLEIAKQPLKFTPRPTTAATAAASAAATSPKPETPEPAFVDPPVKTFKQEQRIGANGIPELVITLDRTKAFDANRIAYELGEALYPDDRLDRAIGDLAIRAKPQATLPTRYGLFNKVSYEVSTGSGNKVITKLRVNSDAGNLTDEEASLLSAILENLNTKLTSAGYTNKTPPKPAELAAKPVAAVAATDALTGASLTGTYVAQVPGVVNTYSFKYKYEKIFDFSLTLPNGGKIIRSNNEEQDIHAAAKEEIMKHLTPVMGDRIREVNVTITDNGVINFEFNGDVSTLAPSQYSAISSLPNYLEQKMLRWGFTREDANNSLFGSIKGPEAAAARPATLTKEELEEAEKQALLDSFKAAYAAYYNKLKPALLLYDAGLQMTLFHSETSGYQFVPKLTPLDPEDSSGPATLTGHAEGVYNRQDIKGLKAAAEHALNALLDKYPDLAVEIAGYFTPSTEITKEKMPPPDEAVSTEWFNPTGQDFLCGFVCMAHVMNQMIAELDGPDAAGVKQNRMLQVYVEEMNKQEKPIPEISENGLNGIDETLQVKAGNAAKAAYAKVFTEDDVTGPPLRYALGGALMNFVLDLKDPDKHDETEFGKKFITDNQAAFNTFKQKYWGSMFGLFAALEEHKTHDKNSPEFKSWLRENTSSLSLMMDLDDTTHTAAKAAYVAAVQSPYYPADIYEMNYMANKLGFNGVANVDIRNGGTNLMEEGSSEKPPLHINNNTERFHWNVAKKLPAEMVNKLRSAKDAWDPHRDGGPAAAAATGPKKEAGALPLGGLGDGSGGGGPEVVFPIKKAPGAAFRSDGPDEPAVEVVLTASTTRSRADSSTTTEDEDPEAALRRTTPTTPPEAVIPERFHDEEGGSIGASTPVIRWSRAWYGMNESNVWYSSNPGFVRARTAQSDSNEYMKFLGKFISELNHKDTGVKKNMVKAALEAIKTQKANFPFSSLAGIITNAVIAECEATPDQAQAFANQLAQAIRNHRLNQYARNSFIWGPTAEDSEFLSRRLNWLGMSNVPRSEIQATLENMLLYWGTSLVPDKASNEPWKSANGSYTVRQVVENDDGTTKEIDLIKVKVDKENHTISISLQPGIDPKDKPDAIRRMVEIHAKHVQESGSNLYEAKLGSNIYDNIRMLQLALYTHNMHIQFQGMTASDAAQKMFGQIDALACNDDEKNKLREEVQYLVDRSQTFGATISRYDYGSKSILDGSKYGYQSREKIQEELSKHHKKAVSEIFTGPSGPAPTTTITATAAPSRPGP